ncbi:MAG TPA: class I SAM-dependent methyltransferase [Caulobacteraceae bacterium]|nr:class I SAM-dependent methyltransferase [Caulobacteraceae bacterium]
MPSVIGDPQLEGLLESLHERSRAQERETEHYWKTRTGPWRGMEARDHAFLADKLVALDRDKAEYCYLLCRAIRARRIVEVGTSCGVSTLYLAAAVRDNGGGIVIGAENEPGKVAAARANFEAAGLSEFIDLREGDLIEAMKAVEGPIDFVLFDVWGHVVRPVLDLLQSNLRPGAVICTDNTASARQGYVDLFEIIGDPAHGFRTMTLPFEGGFEMTVKVG